MSDYSNWTTDGLRGTAMMLIELLSGSLSETGRGSYERMLSSIQTELLDRGDSNDRSLAFPLLKEPENELK